MRLVHIASTAPAPEVHVFVVRTEHAIRDVAESRTAFDADPIGRPRLGVHRDRVLRPVDHPRDVMIDLECATRDSAQACAYALRDLWGRVDVARHPSRTDRRGGRAVTTL